MKVDIDKQQETVKLWTLAREDLLRQSLPAEPDRAAKVMERIRALHPKLKSLASIRRRAKNGMTIDFWKREIDLALIEGIHGPRKERDGAIDRIRSIWPWLSAELLALHMEGLALEQQPIWFQGPFWKAVDPILTAGIGQGKIAERLAVAKLLRLYPELRVERIWARIRELHRQNRKTDARTGPFPWTPEQEQRLVALCGDVGLTKAVSILHQETDCPRNAIVRKAHKLGAPKKEYQRRQEWNEADRTFLLLSLRHLPVKKIARLLGRPEKAVRVQIWREGLPGAWQEGYSRRELCRKFHVALPTLRGWIRAEWLKDGADGRIPDRSVRAFIRQHRDLLDWDRLDAEARQWISELSAAEDGAHRDEAPAGCRRRRD